MRIVNAGMSMESAVQRRQLERLRARVQARVEFEARLRQPNRGSWDLTSGSADSYSPAKRVQEVLQTQAAEAQIEDEVRAQVEAAMRALGAVSGRVDVQTPAAVAERLARGELRFEAEVPADERMRSILSSGASTPDIEIDPKLLRRDRDRYRELDSKFRPRIDTNEQMPSGKEDVGSVPSERGESEVIAQNVAVEQDASRSKSTGQLDERSKAGHEIESSRKQRALEPNHNGISASSADDMETSPDIEVSENVAFEQYQEQRAAMEQVGQILRGQAQHSVHALRTDIAQQASRLLEDSRVNFSGRSPSFAASALIPANDSVNLNASQNVDVSTRSERGILSRQVHVSEIV